MLPGSLDAAGHDDLLAPRRVASTRVASFLPAIRHMRRVVWVWIMRVELRRAMLMLSEHVLSDIGLTRAQVEREYLKPFWRE
jgi:uncharacterized protein YjiS (DUF1127 family)